MARKITLTLHRGDLRIHDNVLFSTAHDPKSDATHVLPIYVFDERFLELSGFPGYKREGPPAKTRVCGFWRTSEFRAQFIAEGVYDLKQNLRSHKSDLLVRWGKLEKVVEAVIKQLKDNGDQVQDVLFQKEFYSEEIVIERKLEEVTSAQGVKLKLYDQAPLVHVDDLPFPVSKTPDVFTPFRKRVEGLPQVGRDPLPTPKQFKPFPTLSSGSYTGYGEKFDDTVDPKEVIAHLVEPLKAAGNIVDTTVKPELAKHTAFPYHGGETSAMERLEWYFHQGEHSPVATYKQTRNGLLGHAFSTKLSPFLAHGMVSPRTVMQYLSDHEDRHGSTQNTYWVRFEILWRDYFYYTSRKFGNAMFHLGGLEQITDPKRSAAKGNYWKDWNPEEDGPDHPARRWLEGRTGIPFIDANMAELRNTGYMSNRGRQNVASFLAKDLEYDWRIGAEFFESQLIDHEPSANYGNWTYVAGVGNDPRAARQFNCVKQSRDYQPDGSYAKTWLPQLSKVPAENIHAPWTMSKADWDKYIDDGAYPNKPVMEQQSWRPHYHRKKGPNKMGVANRNERVKNPGPGGPKKNGGQAKSGEHQNQQSQQHQHQHQQHKQQAQH
ncbi:uncharacterized protein JCM15063_003426 [Sporobolomyces koalae]|uniref:uncharacterized protein n=1 Tax=Sporobolomyces koalae TaxID=500713 RepID=UPI00316E474A